jgi:[protein-PII] uridylyltransferase
VAGSDLRDAVFLVRYHLMLNSAAQRRDTRDPALIRRIARLVRSETRLRLLTLLTVCDLAAVGPSTLTPWKCRLLFELRDRVLARILGEGRPDEPPAERLLRLLPGEEQETARDFLEGMPAEYFSGVDPEHVLADRSLVEAFRSSGGTPVLGVRPVGGATEITLVTRDRPGLLSRFCGLLSAHDLTILRARIATRLDGIVLDRLTVADAGTGGPVSEAREAEVRADLAGALDGSVPVAPLLERHRARWRLRDRQRMEHPVRITYDDRASERYTVLEVRAADHVGLLWAITRTMSEMGAAIHQAFVTTEGERAVDAFYLTDPLGAPMDAATREVLASRLREVLQQGDQSAGK